MASFVTIIKDWQEIIGALIGALAALAVALLVAYSARRREELSAAMVLIGNLTTLKTTESSIQQTAKEQGVEEKDYSRFVAQRLTHLLPKLSPLFDSCVARVMPVNVFIASHLDLLVFYYKCVEQYADKINRDIDWHNEHGKRLRSEEDVQADADALAIGFAQVVKHAECAERLLTQLVMSKWRILHRIRMRIMPTEIEKACSAFLKSDVL